MRFYFLIIGFLFITFKSNSQYNFLYNDSIKYQIGFKTRSIDPNSKSGYFIVISIPEETREKLKKEKMVTH